MVDATGMPVEECQRLTHRDRQMLRLDDLSSADLAAIAKARVPDEYAHLNEEVEHLKR